MEENRDLSDFYCGMLVGARQAGLTGLSEIADIQGFSNTTVSKVYREWSETEKTSNEQLLYLGGGPSLIGRQQLLK